MNDLPNGQVAPSNASLTNFISVAAQHIRERESEILNELLPNELEFMETDEHGAEVVSPITDEPNLLSIREQNGDASLWADPKSAEEEFERDSSDDNESVLSEEDPDNGAPDNDADSLKKEGDGNVQKCLWKEAIDCYTKALNCRQMAALYGNRSLCYMKLGEFEKAERDCCKAIEMDPFYKRIYRRRAAIRLSRRDYFGSAQDLQSFRILSYNAPKLDPNLMEQYKILLPLARLVRMEGDSATRVQELEKVVLAQLCQMEESAAKTFKGRSMWAEAVDSLSVAIIVSPGTARLHYERAVANFKLKKDSLAENDCTVAIDLDPFNHTYYRLRADVRRRLGKIDESKSDEDKAQQLSPTGDEGLSRLEEPASPTSTQPTAAAPAKLQPPPDEPSNVVRIPVRDVYTSNREELFDLSKLPDEIRVCIFS